jgi:glucan phosphoethanolaminetransferase (alkaline phosphatase superfamily)
MDVFHPKINNYFKMFLSRLKEAFPIILFYIIQFLLVSVLFGQQYVMAVACSTTIFQIRRNQYNNILDYIRMFLVSLILCILAYMATRNVFLCILLNLAVPVFLVFWKSSQFTPKGYLGFAMTFVFLELRPLESSEFLTMFFAVLFCSVLLIIALILYANLCFRVISPSKQISNSLLFLSKLLNSLSKEQDAYFNARKELYEKAQMLHRLGHSRHTLFNISAQEQRYCHLFALLFQRAYYLVADETVWQEVCKTPNFSEVMGTLSQLVYDLYKAQSHTEFEKLSENVQYLLDHTQLPQGRLRIFYRSVLHMLIILCKEPIYSAQRPYFTLPTKEEFLLQIKQRFSPESFEFRFAVRLSVVLIISCTVSFLWDFEHTYWFPLHAFLLLQPSYEESTHRMITRPVGTVIACLLVHIIYPYLPGLTGVFVFSLIMIALMYCCTPGSWVHPIFSTSFALTMATLTVEKTEAIELRMFYLALAIILVLVVNYFLLPNRREQQFTRNIHSLFHLQSAYWGVVEKSLREKIDPALFSEMLSQFYMVYHEVISYINQLPPNEKENYNTMQITMWNMFSELEQVECLVQVSSLTKEECSHLGELSEKIRSQLSPPNKNLTNIKTDKIPAGELKNMINNYLKNACVLINALHPIADKYNWEI